MRPYLSAALKVALSLILAWGILWWMYRGADWREVLQTLRGHIRWQWMLWSVPFGIAAQVFRGLRWRQTLEPLGERPRRAVCIDAVFLSYASSLVIPRVGEVLRCGVLRRWEAVSLARSAGTVVAERVLDMRILLALSLVSLALQLPGFARFASDTGLTLSSLLQGFTRTGYLVTALCLLFIAAAAVYLCLRLRALSGARSFLRQLWQGLTSIRQVRGKTLFVAYSLGIWAAYYLHFYLAFFCFPYTQSLGPSAALVAFVVGTYAVLVPTPNGAGAWHFAVKTVLMLYGISAPEGATFVLIVHSLQTLLVVLLGLYSLASLALRGRKASPQL